MECKDNFQHTNEVKSMIRQSAISVKLEESKIFATNFPGVVPLARLAESFGLFRDLEELLPAKQRRRGYSNSQSVFDLMCIPFAGGECIEDLDRLRADAGLSRLLGRKVIASSTAHEFLRRIMYDGLDGLAKVRSRMLSRMAKAGNVTTATLDCDASLFASSGKNARMSYKGVRGYMPMLAFWDELGTVAHDDFRNGNESPGSRALEFLKDTLAQLPDSVKHINIRSDSAWHQSGIFDFCDDNGHGFCIGASRDEAVNKGIGSIKEGDWQRINLSADPSDDEPYVREWAAETVHTLNASDRAYRMIIIRKERLQDDLEYGPYRYHVLITNMELPLEEQIAWYRMRGRCEQQIGELKWDFELRVLPSGDYFVNAIYLRIMTLAYNLFVALKQIALPGEYKKCRLKKIMFHLLRIPAIIICHARRLVMKLPRGHPGAKLFAAIS